MKLTLLAALVFAVGCTTAGQQAPTVPDTAQAQPPAVPNPGAAHMHGHAHGGMHQHGETVCPMMSQSAEVAPEDTPHGVAFLMTPRDGDLAALKAGVDRMVEMHNNPAHREMMARQGRVESTASAVQGADNIRLEFTAVNRAEAATLQTQMKEHMAMMQSGQCPMMGN